MSKNNISLLFNQFENRNLVETFLRILDSIHEGIAIIDKKSMITYANPSYTRILGIPREKVIGKKLTEIEPESKALHVLKSQEPILGEYELVKTIDKHILLDSTGIYLDGQMAGVISIFRDVTDIIKLNQKLEYYRNYVINLKKNKQVVKDELPSAFNSIIGNDPSFVKILQLSAKVAPTDAAILLEGESGSGKELLAKAIHATSARHNKPMVAVNCAAIPEALFESELFGYEEGAFTGAKKSGKKGKFELANGSSIFLDEIGELPLGMQAKLMRVLQEGQVDRIGSERLIPVDVRIIAATNKCIADLLEQGKFRKDLYFRLNVINIKIPPLRERPSDILLLTEEFFKKFNKPNLKFSSEVLNAFYKYPWFGNVRELENVVKHVAIICQNNEITLDDLPDYFREQLLKSTSYERPYEKEIKLELKGYVANAEKEAILKALRECHDNRTKAMRLLGISRRAFYKKLKKYKLLKDGCKKQKNNDKITSSSTLKPKEEF